MKQVMNEAELVQASLKHWQIDRVCFLINNCGISYTNLIKTLNLTMTVGELKRFARFGEGLTDEQIMELHRSLNGFFRP